MSGCVRCKRDFVLVYIADCLFMSSAYLCPDWVIHHHIEAIKQTRDVDPMLDQCWASVVGS